MADIIELIYEDHRWLRRQFAYLDDATTVAQLTAIWVPLGVRLDTHAAAEETVFYPALLKKGEAGDPEDETEDAIRDHNEIREAVADAARHPVGSPDWYDAVGRARTENGEHLDEEEREALPDFAKSADLQLRHDLAMKWLAFYYEHGRLEPTVDTSEKDPDTYIRENS